MFTVTNAEDSLECHNEKLVSGSTAEFVQSGRLFLNRTVFDDGHPWPDVIAAPAFFTAKVKDPNFAITVRITHYIAPNLTLSEARARVG